MAKGGAGAAYKQLTAPNDGLTQSIQFWGQQHSNTIKDANDRMTQDRRRKEDKEEAAAIRKEERNNELIDNLNYDPKDMAAVMTSQKDFDMVTKNYGASLVDMMGKAKLSGISKLQEGDIEGYYAEASKIKKYQTAMGTYNNLAEKVGESVVKYAEKAQSGKLNPNDKSSMIMDAIVGHNYIPRVDENGNQTLLVGVDKNKDGVISDEEKAAGEAFFENGVTAEGFEFVEVDPYGIADNSIRPFEKVDIVEPNGLLDQFAASVGVLTKAREGEGYIRTSTGFNPKNEEALRRNIRASLADPEKLSWVLTSLDGSTKASHNIKDYTEDEKKRAEDFLFESTKAKFDESSSVGSDPTAIARERLAEQREARIADDKRADKKLEEEEETTANTLKFDIQEAVNSGDYTVLKRSLTTERGTTFNITDVVEVKGADGTTKLRLIKDRGLPETIEKTERAIAEFVINNGGDSYKNVKVDEVLKEEPYSYRESKPSSTSIKGLVEKLFDSEGNPIGDEDEIIELANKLGVKTDDTYDLLSPDDKLEINGVELTTKAKAKIIKAFEDALGSSLPEQPKDSTSDDADKSINIQPQKDDGLFTGGRVI